MPEPSDYWKRNSSFLPNIPIQHSYDSTSLGALKTCPRFYQLSIIEGWQPKHTSIHLLFGLYYHSSLEHYDRSITEGKTKHESLISTVRYALQITWEPPGHPWFSDDRYKNRYTLIRTIVWYLDQFKDDPLETIILAEGKPAVELSFRMPTYIPIPDNNGYYVLCGHIDRIANVPNDGIYIVDRKTSKSIIDQRFFDNFSPDNQMSLYHLAGKIVYKEPIKGIIIDGAQIAVGFSRFMRGLVQRTEAELNEWFEDFRIYTNLAETYAKANYWPMNDKACGMYGGCRFREICSKPPHTRQMWLQANFTQRLWDPLITRGDI